MTNTSDCFQWSQNHSSDLEFYAFDNSTPIHTPFLEWVNLTALLMLQAYSWISENQGRKSHKSAQSLDIFVTLLNQPLMAILKKIGNYLTQKWPFDLDRQTSSFE